MKKIAFGCDHVGFMLKEDILAHLRARGIDVVDKGTCSPERTDYPYYASAVAQAIIDKEVDGGILICGTGVGSPLRPISSRASAQWSVANLIQLSFQGSITTRMCWHLVRAWSDWSWQK